MYISIWIVLKKPIAGFSKKFQMMSKRVHHVGSCSKLLIKNQIEFLSKLVLTISTNSTLHKHENNQTNDTKLRKNTQKLKGTCKKDRFQLVLRSLDIHKMLPTLSKRRKMKNKIITYPTIQLNIYKYLQIFLHNVCQVTTPSGESSIQDFSIFTSHAILKYSLILLIINFLGNRYSIS